MNIQDLGAIGDFAGGILLKRLGFREIGVSEKYLQINGRWEDHVLTCKLNPYWQKS